MREVCDDRCRRALLLPIGGSHVGEGFLTGLPQASVFAHGGSGPAAGSSLASFGPVWLLLGGFGIVLALLFG